MSDEVLPVSVNAAGLVLARDVVRLVVQTQAFWAEMYSSMWADAVAEGRFTVWSASVFAPTNPSAVATAADTLTPSLEIPAQPSVELVAQSWHYANWVGSDPGNANWVTAFLSAAGQPWVCGYDNEEEEFVVWCDANFFPDDTDDTDDAPLDGDHEDSGTVLTFPGA